MTKARSDSMLSKLTEEQQNQVYDWLISLGYTETLNKVAAPAPNGFALRTHRHSLQRFFKRHRQKLRTEEIAAAKENRSRPEDASVLVSDAEQSVQYAAQQLASSPMDSDQFRDVSRWLATHKNHELKRDYYQLAAQQLALARERLAFDRERYEFDTARTVLIHHIELEKIRQHDTLEDEEKIDMARSLIFNRPISELPPRINPAPGA
jgi:hypothetical protein